MLLLILLLIIMLRVEREKKIHILYIYIYIVLATRVIKIRIQDFWSSGCPLVQGSGRPELGSFGKSELVQEEKGHF